MIKERLSLLLLAAPCFLPAIWRFCLTGLAEPVGLLSDLGLGCLLLVLIRLLPRWLKAVVLIVWALFQLISVETFAAVGRFPSWQDLPYLLDLKFIERSGAGFHLAEPLYTLLLLATTLLAIPVLLRRPSRLLSAGGLALGLALLFSAGYGGARVNQSVAARYNPLHWFVMDVVAAHRQQGAAGVSVADLPQSLRTLDMSGQSLLTDHRIKNVLIVVLEGISGIYNPEIRAKMGVADGPFQMTGLAGATRDAMLIPDFVTHSHQTIRGLYAIHCGDVSKLSYDMPKGMELELNPQRAGECLPAQLAAGGWTTHYLQGAPLQFMNKDTVMPAMGFQQVHGLEWFADRREKDFVWGTTDPDFFAGAARYVRQLQRQEKPWLLSLLTVATHQPFDAPETLLKKYGDRKIAAVARLDEAVADFLEGLRRDGILDTTLVLVTSDESHGYVGADWYSSWGTMMVLAPDQPRLPRIKTGVFGLLDVEPSLLDYLQRPMPPSIIGRSFFRDYSAPRDMASYTSGKLRWQTADNRLFECSVDGVCYVADNAEILAPNRTAAHLDTAESGAKLFSLASLLDHKLTVGIDNQRLEFGRGEIRQLPKRIRNEWTDNLVGAEYLNFPKDSTVAVDIRLKAVTAAADGIQMRLVLRQFEQQVGDISYPPFPLLREGEECHIQFHFTNPQPRQSFSFHLVGEGENSSIQLEKFEVAISRGG
ncbi:MAG: LTA synthase family protein [Desulfopila sp.]